jgi:hypothetical protein
MPKRGIMMDEELKELERRTYLTFMDDGLLDLFVGWFLFFFSAGVAPGMDFPYLFMIAYLPLWFVAKRAIIYPRIGKVEFGPERKERMREEKRFFVLFLSATSLLGMLFFLSYTPGIFPEEIAQAVRGLGLVPLALIGAAAIAFTGYWKQLNRFYAYAALLAAMSIGGHALGAEPYLYFLIPGMMIGLAGGAQLINFIQKYSLPKEGG